MLPCKFVVVISVDAFCCCLFVVVFIIALAFARTKKQKRETKKKMGCVAFVSCPPEFGLSLPETTLGTTSTKASNGWCADSVDVLFGDIFLNSGNPLRGFPELAIISTNDGDDNDDDWSVDIASLPPHGGCSGWLSGGCSGGCSGWRSGGCSGWRS